MGLMTHRSEKQTLAGQLILNLARRCRRARNEVRRARNASDSDSLMWGLHMASAEAAALEAWNSYQAAIQTHNQHRENEHG